MAIKSERYQILEMIENGVITAAEGARLLAALSDGFDGDESGENRLLAPLEDGEDGMSGEPENTAFPGKGLPATSVPERPVEPAVAPAETGAEQPAESGNAASLPTQSGAEQLAGNGNAASLPTFDPALNRWRIWWLLPLWAGMGLVVAGGLLMFLAYQATGFSFWFGCAWLPFLLGVAAMAVAWSARASRWLHLRIRQGSGE
jgi:hypothetical protein